MNFRKDINGLRAISVVVVMLYHFGFSGFSGGFIGVDVFFVISGYLMTAIILGKTNTGQFSLIDFYLSRGKRILPPLAILCAVLIIWGWFYLYPTDFKELGKHIKSSLGFSSNISYFKESGYFDTSSRSKWLLHTWSLSVEWQFYMLYPVVILALKKWLRAQYITPSLVALTTISFFACIYHSYENPNLAFYSFHTRAWEMLAGGLVYCSTFKPKPNHQLFCEALGLAMIIFSVVFLSNTSLWPSLLTLIPVTGCALIIFSNKQHNSLLNAQPFQSIGSASYSIYLWHWPLVVYLEYTGRSAQLMPMVIGVLLSFLLGWLSWRHIEKGMVSRILTFSTRRSGFIKLLGLFLIVFIAASYIRYDRGIPHNYRAINTDERSLFIEKYKNAHQALGAAYRSECDFYDLESKPFKKTIDASCVVNSKKPSLFIWGDSHAQALSPGLRQQLKQDYQINQIATSGCQANIVFVQDLINNAKECFRANQFVLLEIERTKPSIVIIAQRMAHEDTDWREVADKILNVGAEYVVIVGPVPQWLPSLPQVIARRHWNKQSNYINDRGIDQEILATDQLMTERYKSSKNLTYISMIDAMCINKKCLAYVPNNKKLMVVDYGHLSVEGSNYVAKHILKTQLNRITRLRNEQ